MAMSRAYGYRARSSGSRYTDSRGRIYVDHGDGWRRQLPGIGLTCRQWKQQRKKMRRANRSIRCQKEVTA